MTRTGRISPSITASLWPRAVAGLLLAALLVACPEAAQDRAGPGPARRGEEVVVASFNFPESALLAEIYAGAVEAAGIPVRRELQLGPRELVQPALLQGFVDVLPEYLGTAAASLSSESPVNSPDPGELRRQLERAAARWDVHVLDPAPAQNQNGLAVTRRTAERLQLRTVTDLSRASASLTVGGPPECPNRPYCLPGLARVYGLHFGAFLPFDSERQRMTALREGVVDVVVAFTTDGELARDDLVLLEDDRRLQPPENVAPLVSGAAVDRYGHRLRDALDAVSSRLTTDNLRFLNWRVAVAGNDVKSEARGWLERHQLVPARG